MNRGFFMHNRGRYFVQQGGPSPDVTAPTVPSNLAASAITATTLTLTWDASTDAVGVTEYEVQQRLASGVNGDYVTIATVAAPTVTLAVTGLIGNTEYRFRVRARDAAANVSAWGPDDTGLLADTFVFVAPAFNGTVNVVVPDGAGGAFVGGAYTQITDANGVQSRARVAHLDAYGIVSAWNPGSDQEVYDIAVVDADYVAIAKMYNATLASNTLGGYDCRGFGLVHRGTGVAVVWDPAVTRAVYTIAVDGGKIFRAGAAATGNLRSHTIATKTLDAWDPSVNAAVIDVAIDGANLITAHAGSASVGSVTRSYFAKTSTTVSAGGVSTFDALVTNGFSQASSATQLGANRLLVTGEFLTNVGAQVVRGAAIVNQTTGAVEAWTLDANASSNMFRHAAAFDRLVAFTATAGIMRVFNLVTGVQLATIGVTGTAISGVAVYGRKFWFPTRTRCIVFGAMTALGSRVVSGTSRMFVIDVP